MRIESALRGETKFECVFMSLEFLRIVIDNNSRLIERLHEAERRCDPDAVRELLAELDLNNADLHVALEDLTSFPPPRLDTQEDGGAG